MSYHSSHENVPFPMNMNSSWHGKNAKSAIAIRVVRCKKYAKSSQTIQIQKKGKKKADMIEEKSLNITCAKSMQNVSDFRADARPFIGENHEIDTQQKSKMQ
jgi:hypothetical protein